MTDFNHNQIIMNLLAKASAIAASKVGFKEATGNNDGPFVDECLAVTGFDNQKQIKATGKGYAWCAAFISWVLKSAGAEIIPTAWAPSWFPTAKLVTNGKYRPMDVFGYNYNKITNGHVGFIFYWPDEGDLFLSLEGNWGNCVGINVRKKTDVNQVSRWL